MISHNVMSMTPSKMKKLMLYLGRPKIFILVTSEKAYMVTPRLLVYEKV
jgi:hypothetical protein